MKADLAEAVTLGQFEGTTNRSSMHGAAGSSMRGAGSLASPHARRPAGSIHQARRTDRTHPGDRRIRLRAACTEAARWPESVAVSVNLSAVQFGRGNLVGSFAKMLADTGLTPSRLTFKVTETALMADIVSSREILTAIREIGVRIALDDFGTGYSSLSYLQAFPLHSIKIDRSFVAAMETDSQTQDIVAFIAAIAKRLGALVFAEGVETRAQLDLVCAAGCDRAQGYWFSKASDEGT